MEFRCDIIYSCQWISSIWWPKSQSEFVYYFGFWLLCHFIYLFFGEGGGGDYTGLCGVFIVSYLLSFNYHQLVIEWRDWSSSYCYKASVYLRIRCSNSFCCQSWRCQNRVWIRVAFIASWRILLNLLLSGLCSQGKCWFLHFWPDFHFTRTICKTYNRWVDQVLTSILFTSCF